MTVRSAASTLAASINLYCEYHTRTSGTSTGWPL
jgi:hypothetical protein